MTKYFNFASDRRVHALLCCSAAVLLSACGGGTTDTGNAQPTQTAATAFHSDTNKAAATVVATDSSTAVTDQASAAPASDAPADDTRLLATSAAVGAPTATSDNLDLAGNTPTQALAVTPDATAICNYYIAPTGSDSGAGTLASPWKTVNYASAKLSAGKTLCARGGTYYKQAGNIWHSSGTATAPVTFKNYPGEKPVFDGEWGDTGTSGDFIIFSGNSHVVVDGITAQRYADQYGNGTIDLHNGLGPVDDIIIQNSTFIDNGSHTAQDHHIYLATGTTNVTIRNNLFIRGAGSAIQAYHSPASNGIKIYNNVMIGGTLKCSASRTNYCSPTARQHWGMIIGDAKGTQIYNNTIYGMDYGIDFSYGTSTTGPYVVKNNLIVNSTSAGIRVASAYAPYFTSDYNGFSGNASDINWKGANVSAAQFAVTTTNERHAVKANPMFVNAAASDFHLAAGSPMIDKATAMTLFNTDKDGVLRPRGLAFDIGAYEK
ncbi:MAG: right-handed parallel beta-helix repeat-containing protein [Pseudomonadota bacterium]|nr:right-handed parallel beta-helix repeat-containing protein [Pseudomonadota bacterium]